MRYLTTFVCFVAICLSLLFVNRLYLTERIIENRLQAIGGTDIQVAVSGLSGTGLLVDSLNVRFPDEFPVQSVLLHSFTFPYNLKELIKGNIEGPDIFVGVIQARFSHDFPLQNVRLDDLTLPYKLRELLRGNVKIPGLLVHSLEASFSHKLAIESLTISDLSLHSEQGELLKGKIKELDIGELTLRLGKQGEKETNTSPVDIRTHLPKKISIHKLTLPVSQIEGDLNLQLFIHNRDDNPLDIQLNLAGHDISLAGWDLSSLTGKLLLQTDTGTDMSLLKGSHVEIGDVHGGANHLEKVDLQLSGKLAKIKDKGWQAGPATIIAETGGIHFQDLSVKPSPVSLHILEPLYLSPPIQMQSSLDTSALLLKWKNKSIPLKDVHLDLALNTDTVQLSTLFSHTFVPGQIEGTLSHNLKQNTGRALFTTPLPLDLNGEKTNSTQLIKGLQLPFLLSKGLVNVTSEIQWEDMKPLFMNSNFELRDGAGEYKKFTFSGLNVQQDLQLFPAIHTLQPGTLFLRELESGFTVNNIELHNQIIHTTGESRPTLLIDSVEAEILGAKISSQEIRIDSLLQELDIPVQLLGIPLDKVINLNKVKGLTVTGVMDGSVRLQRKNGQFSIPEGELRSRDPGGVISYIPPGGSKAVSQLPAYAMKALQEFKYDTLIATPRYEPGGLLKIAIHTEGHSPPLNTTRPVHLNLNTEQNLLSLLKSLRYSKTLTDDLETRLQKRQPKN